MMMLPMCCAARTKETKQVHHAAVPVVNAGKPVGSHRSNSNGEVPKGTDVCTVVFPTSVSLVELRPPPPEEEEKPPPPPVRRGRAWSTVDRLPLEIGHESVTSSAPEETAEELEARVRRSIEIEIRQEMKEAAAKKEDAARENAEARKVQKLVQEAAELTSREAKAAAEVAKDAATQRERHAAEAVAREASEARVRDMMREAEAAEAEFVALVATVAAAEAAAQRTAVEEAERCKAAALAEKADVLLKAGHAPNKQGDYAKARPAMHPASPVPPRSSSPRVVPCPPLPRTLARVLRTGRYFVK